MIHDNDALNVSLSAFLGKQLPHGRIPPRPLWRTLKRRFLVRFSLGDGEGWK
jgi:hypothetical protein